MLDRFHHNIGRARTTPPSMSVIACAIASLVLFGASAKAQVISGIPRIVDGDTIAVAAVTIRLEGIDAPESDQVCLDAQVAKWTCGVEASRRLFDHIAGRAIDCTPTGQDAYRRVLAVCRLGTDDLNAWMVQQGWALAFVRYSSMYIHEEESARAAFRGMWSGAFIAPWDWRHRGGQTVILGAVSVPVAAQSLLLAPASAAGAPSTQCLIKGNVSRNGDHIYHLPGSVHYAQVNMNSGKKRWFCTEEEARSAGWRPAAR